MKIPHSLSPEWLSPVPCRVVYCKGKGKAKRVGCSPLHWPCRAARVVVVQSSSKCGRESNKTEEHRNSEKQSRNSKLETQVKVKVRSWKLKTQNLKFLRIEISLYCTWPKSLLFEFSFSLHNTQYTIHVDFIGIANAIRFAVKSSKRDGDEYGDEGTIHSTQTRTNKEKRKRVKV